jgi:hypothetical protein
MYSFDDRIIRPAFGEGLSTLNPTNGHQPTKPTALFEIGARSEILVVSHVEAPNYQQTQNRGVAHTLPSPIGGCQSDKSK